MQVLQCDKCKEIYRERPDGKFFLEIIRNGMKEHLTVWADCSGDLCPRCLAIGAEEIAKELRETRQT